MIKGRLNNMYTNERNAQIVIVLLKAHKIKRIVVSPGSTNTCLVASLQCDDYFQLYSAPDERSAAYIACGLAAESCEPVVLSCTGATASRNYYPGLTEAFYRKLPVLAITSSRRNSRIGHNFDQVTDRTLLPNDIVKLSVQMPVVLDNENEWACVIAANKAMLELRHRGGGPVHINLETMYSPDCSVKEIPPVRAIYRISYNDQLPEISANRIAIFVGSHSKWSSKLQGSVDNFCKKYNAVVLCDHTSNYHGSYRIMPSLSTNQKAYNSVVRSADMIIHLGNISTCEYGIKPKKTWRVNPDGEVKDTFFSLEYVFEMDEEDFFTRYVQIGKEKENTFFRECSAEDAEIRKDLPEIPFSNIWTAMNLSKILPKHSEIHLGIRNSLRSWNFFEIDSTITGFSNVGGFGIDGSLSTALGASLCSDEKIVYCVLGDLAFFYDMNALGNRHINRNLRILLVNNGTGREMRFSTFLPSKTGMQTEPYISATGHYGKQSSTLVQHYVTDLGFEYISASSKKDFLDRIDDFIDSNPRLKPLVFEIFTNPNDEDEAYNLFAEIKANKGITAKNALYDALGKKNVDAIKKLIRH